MIGWLQVGVEVNIPGENVWQIQGQLIPFIQFIEGVEKRILDSSTHKLWASFILSRLKLRLVTFLGKIDLEIFVQVNLIAELPQGSIWKPFQLKLIAYDQLLQVIDRFGNHNQFLNKLPRKLVGRKDITERHVPLDLACKSFN